MTMQAYDLDDTLARVDFRDATQESLVDLFTAAPVLYVPTVNFVVITGRPHSTAAQRKATDSWLAEHEPHCQGVHYVTPGDAAATARTKAAAIKNLKVTDYTDNNAEVLAELAGLTAAQLWHIQDGKRTAYVDRAALAKAWAPTL